MVWHSPASPLQALAIERVLSEKNDLDYAGAVLWLAGFEADERYWRERLTSQDAKFQRATNTVRLALQRHGDHARQTLGNRAAKQSGLPSVLFKMRRRLGVGDFAALIDTAANMSEEEFEDFADTLTNHGERSNVGLFETGLDIEGGETHQIYGQRLTLTKALGPVLSDISTSLDRFQLTDFTTSELNAARDDVRRALKIGICTFNMSSRVFGSRALGLRLVAFIARSATLDLLFSWIALFARVRRGSSHLYSTQEIAVMARHAEASWLIGEYFWALQSGAEIHKIAGPSEFKVSLQDSVSLPKMLENLRGYPLPRPELRPWRTWRKLAKKTMSPGLLAMSIGSPEEATLEQIVAAANEPDSH